MSQLSDFMGDLKLASICVWSDISDSKKIYSKFRIFNKHILHHQQLAGYNPESQKRKLCIDHIRRALSDIVLNPNCRSWKDLIVVYVVVKLTFGGDRFHERGFFVQVEDSDVGALTNFNRVEYEYTQQKELYFLVYGNDRKSTWTAEIFSLSIQTKGGYAPLFFPVGIAVEQYRNSFYSKYRAWCGFYLIRDEINERFGTFCFTGDISIFVAKIITKCVF